MSNKTESWSVYHKAHRAGQKETRRLLRKGADPHLKVMDSVMDHSMATERISLGVMDIPIDKIVGITDKEKRGLYTFDFLPLSAPDGEFASKWTKLYWYYLSNHAGCSPVTCYEYMGEFYIVDGIKRVSIAKCHGLPTIPATVTRILPANTQTEAVQRYLDQVKCVDLTGLYQIVFSQTDSFARFQKALGHEPDYKWTEADRLDFLFHWHTFDDALREAFNGYLRITPADAFLILLDEHPYERLREMPHSVLVNLLRKSYKKLYAIHSAAESNGDAYVGVNTRTLR